MGADVAKQRSTFGKLERQRAQQAVAKAKHERRTARPPEGAEERPATTTDPAVEADVLDKFARLQAAFDDGQMSLDDFELRRNELRDRLQT
jgi:chorismate mutase